MEQSHWVPCTMAAQLSTVLQAALSQGAVADRTGVTECVVYTAVNSMLIATAAFWIQFGDLPCHFPATDMFVDRGSRFQMPNSGLKPSIFFRPRLKPIWYGCSHPPPEPHHSLAFPK